jgi:hypothetical protein
MVRFLLTASLFLAGLGLPACQSYTTSLEQGPRRVDEKVAISTLRTIAQAQTAYSVSNSGDYGTFEQLAAGAYLDSRFNSSQPKIYGYILTMTVAARSSGSSESSYHCNADPDPEVNPAGRHFYLGSTSTEILVNSTRPATANDETLQP